MLDHRNQILNVIPIQNIIGKVCVAWFPFPGPSTDIPPPTVLPFRLLFYRKKPLESLLILFTSCTVLSPYCTLEKEAAAAHGIGSFDRKDGACKSIYQIPEYKKYVKYGKNAQAICKILTCMSSGTKIGTKIMLKCILTICEICEIHIYVEYV